MRFLKSQFHLIMLIFQNASKENQLESIVPQSHLMCSKLPIFFFFVFLVLCLPRQIHTSNGTIHRIIQLSSSICCYPLSSSGPITSFSVFLLSFSLSFFPRLSFLEGSALLLSSPTSFSVFFGLFL